jgi:transcriptional repressor NrdR
LRCPFCKSENLKVLESRSADDDRSIRRRRECIECEQRFTTYERVEFNPMIVTKKSGSKEIYSREKLVSSIVRSCSKSQITAITIDSIVDQVEATMYQRYSREVPSSALGSMVMAELKIQDPMAYIRYASIFKKINSIGEFIDEMKNLEDSVLGIEFQPIG